MASLCDQNRFGPVHTKPELSRSSAGRRHIFLKFCSPACCPLHARNNKESIPEIRPVLHIEPQRPDIFRVKSVFIFRRIKCLVVFFNFGYAFSIEHYSIPFILCAFLCPEFENQVDIIHTLSLYGFKSFVFIRHI